MCQIQIEGDLAATPLTRLDVARGLCGGQDFACATPSRPRTEMGWKGNVDDAPQIYLPLTLVTSLPQLQILEH